MFCGERFYAVGFLSAPKPYRFSPGDRTGFGQAFTIRAAMQLLTPPVRIASHNATEADRFLSVGPATDQVGVDLTTPLPSQGYASVPAFQEKEFVSSGGEPHLPGAFPKRFLTPGHCHYHQIF
jgi:hypothetical protein